MTVPGGGHGRDAGWQHRWTALLCETNDAMVAQPRNIPRCGVPQRTAQAADATKATPHTNQV